MSGGSSATVSATTLVPIIPSHFKITKSAPLETSAIITISTKVVIPSAIISYPRSPATLAAGLPSRLPRLLDKVHQIDSTDENDRNAKNQNRNERHDNLLCCAHQKTLEKHAAFHRK